MALRGLMLKTVNPDRNAKPEIRAFMNKMLYKT